MTNLQKMIGKIMPDVRADWLGEDLYLGSNEDHYSMDPKRLEKYHEMVQKVESVANVPVSETVKAIERAFPDATAELTSVKGFWVEHQFWGGTPWGEYQQGEYDCINISGGCFERPTKMVSRTPKKDENATFIFSCEYPFHCDDANPSVTRKTYTSFLDAKVLFTAFDPNTVGVVRSNPVNWTGHKIPFDLSEQEKALENAIMIPVEQAYEREYGDIEQEQPTLYQKVSQFVMNWCRLNNSKVR